MLRKGGQCSVAAGSAAQSLPGSSALVCRLHAYLVAASCLNCCLNCCSAGPTLQGQECLVDVYDSKQQQQQFSACKTSAAIINGSKDPNNGFCTDDVQLSDTHAEQQQRDATAAAQDDSKPLDPTFACCLGAASQPGAVYDVSVSGPPLPGCEQERCAREAVGRPVGRPATFLSMLASTVSANYCSAAGLVLHAKCMGRTFETTDACFWCLLAGQDRTCAWSSAGLCSRAHARQSRHRPKDAPHTPCPSNPALVVLIISIHFELLPTGLMTPTLVSLLSLRQRTSCKTSCPWCATCFKWRTRSYPFSLTGVCTSSTALARLQ